MTAAARRGRPRNPETDRAILDGVIAILIERGFEGLTMDAAAEAAGVSRPTVYRRFPSRDVLVEAAVDRLMDSVTTEVPRGLDGRSEVLALLSDTLTMLRETPVGPLFRGVIPYLPRYPALTRMANELGQRRRRRLRSAFDRAAADGSLVTSRDVGAVIDGVLGAVYFRYFITGRRLDRAYVAGLLDALI